MHAIRPLYLIPLIALLMAMMPAHAETLEQNGFRYDIAEAPGWVVNKETPKKEVAPFYGLRLLQRDWQLNWQGSRPEHYVRQLVEVASARGIDDAAKYQLEYNPVYETLTLHALRIKRNGQWSNRLNGKIVELLRRESNLESSQYDGRVTASINLPDVRVGDQVELAYTIAGQNPIFAGYLTTKLSMVHSHPMGSMHVRILVPRAMPLAYKMIGETSARVEDSVSGETRTLLINHQQLAPLVIEDRTPTSTLQFPFLQVSTFKDWDEVIRWGRTLFETAEPNSEEFRQKVAELKKIKKPAERVMAALNFVQEEVRYFGVEISVNSHKPYPPDQIIGQRFGDCKDKTLLLHWLLKASGIRSTPALVSFSRGGMLHHTLASSDMFDHVILRLQEGGKTYWLDPTITGQSRNLATLGLFRYGYALPLESNEHGLTLIEPARSTPSRASTSERFIVPDLSGNGELIVESEFHLDEAERVRRRFQRSGKEDLQQQWHDAMKKRYPGAELVGDLQMQDNMDSNVLKTREHYRIPEIFNYAEGIARFQISAEDLQAYLVRPEKTTRRFAIDLPHPLDIDYSYELKSPLVRKIDDKPEVHEDPHVRFVIDKKAEDGRLQITMSLKILRAEVPPEKAAAYLKVAQAINGETSLSYNGSVLDTTRVTEEMEASLRKQNEKMQPDYWKDTYIKNVIKLEAWQRVLNKLKPSPQITASLQAYMGWSNLDMGEPEKARERLPIIEGQPDFGVELKAYGAAVNLYSNQPDIGWRYFEEHRASASKELSWYDTRVGALLCVMRGRYDEGRKLLNDYLVKQDSSKQDVARWLALTLRLQYGPTPAAEKNWPRDLYDMNSDRVVDVLLRQPDKQLEKLGDLYRAIDPEGAARVWMALALNAKKQGDTARANEHLQRILDQRIGVLTEYGMARGMKASMQGGDTRP